MSVEIDWDEMGRENDRMVAMWKSRAHPSMGPSSSDIDAFDYGFELGWRIAKGEVIE